MSRLSLSTMQIADLSAYPKRCVVRIATKKHVLQEMALIIAVHKDPRHMRMQTEIVHAVREQFAEQVAVTDQHRIVRMKITISAVQQVKKRMKTAMVYGSAVQRVRYTKTQMV